MDKSYRHISQTPNHVIVSESGDCRSIAEINTLDCEALIVSFVVVPWVDFGRTRRMFGRQWHLKASDGPCILEVSSSESVLRSSSGALTPIVSWAENQLEESEVYAAVISIHTQDAQPKEDRTVEFVYATRKTLALLDHSSVICANERDATLLTCSRFATLLTDNCAISLKGKSVLVSGCGPGGECAIAQDLGAASVVGIDTDAAQILAAQSRFAQRPHLRFYSYEGHTIPEPDNSFDVIITRHVLEHIERPFRSHYCAELMRVLRDGGAAIFEFPNQRCPVEPHTETEFFHLLDPQLRAQVIRYLLQCEAAGLPRHPQLDLFIKLGSHSNLLHEEFIECLPASAIITREYRINPSIPMDDACCPWLRYEIVKRCGL